MSSFLETELNDSIIESCGMGFVIRKHIITDKAISNVGEYYILHDGVNTILNCLVYIDKNTETFTLEYEVNYQTYKVSNMYDNYDVFQFMLMPVKEWEMNRNNLIHILARQFWKLMNSVDNKSEMLNLCAEQITVDNACKISMSINSNRNRMNI